jgi:hypothetical protein
VLGIPAVLVLDALGELALHAEKEGKERREGGGGHDLAEWEEGAKRRRRFSFPPIFLLPEPFSLLCDVSFFPSFRPSKEEEGKESEENGAECGFLQKSPSAAEERKRRRRQWRRLRCLRQVFHFLLTHLLLLLVLRERWRRESFERIPSISP